MRAKWMMAVLLGCLISPLVLAMDMTSPIGKWKTIDDKTGKPKSVIQLYEEEGELKGKVLEILTTTPGEETHPKCTKCSGELKDQPVVGMVFLWGLKKHDGEYKDGHILDPKNGTVYNAKLTLIEEGKKLKVRGFIGFSLLGRTQIWLRD